MGLFQRRFAFRGAGSPAPRVRSLVGEDGMRPNALFQLGMDLGTPSTSRKEDSAVVSPASAEAEARDDHFVVRNGVRCAGVHLIVDLYDAERLDDVDHIEAAPRRERALARPGHVSAFHEVVIPGRAEGPSPEPMTTGLRRRHERMFMDPG